MDMPRSLSSAGADAAWSMMIMYMPRPAVLGGVDAAWSMVIMDVHFERYPNWCPGARD